MSQPMRFPRRFPWLLAVPLVLLFGLPVFIPIVAWVCASGPPLRSYYLLAYLDSSERKGWPGATPRIRWVYKTAPHRKAELATEQDVVAARLAGNGGRKNPHVPFRLTPSAEGEGRTDVIEGPPEKVPSAQLAEYLKDAIYGGETFWRMALKPLLAVLGGLFCLLALRAWRQSRASQEQRHGRRTRGPELRSAVQWLRGWLQSRKAAGIGFRLRFESPLLDWLPFGPVYRIPRRLESSHILLMGDTGAGKSSAIRQLLRQVEGRGESAIVYDPAMDFVGEFYSPARGDLILNPLDARCPYWALGSEIDREETATAIAAAVLPEKEYEKVFFTDGPRRILAHLLRSGPQPRDILKMMADPAWIELKVKGTPLAALLDPGAPAQRAGVLSSLNMVADCLELLPEWEHTRPTFATSEWNTERKRWVFLTSQPAYREKILPLHSVWLDLFILRMMGYCEDLAARPVWFVLDELASLHKLPQLHTAVTENRKYGNPVVVGFQGRSQLEKRYGQDAEAMLSQPATKVFFKTSEPRAAKWISEAIGEIEVERLKESRSMGLISGKKSYALDIATKPLVMASEISGLEPLRAFIKRENQVVPVRFQLAKKRGRQPEFIERRMPTLALRPALSMPASPAELPRKPAQVSLPFSDPPAAQPQKVYVWDESKGID
jgi:hypothetical protein